MGDRIIAMNGVNVDGVATAHQALKLVQEGGDQLDMEVVFDVTGESCDSHVTLWEVVVSVHCTCTWIQQYFLHLATL